MPRSLPIDPALARLRLMQIADSSFPVGGFSYSHGLEWMAHEGIVTSEADLGPVVAAYIAQAGEGQWMPAALAAWRADSPRQTRRIDERLDLSMVVRGERDASLAMGLRLLRAATDGLETPASSELLRAEEEGQTQGHYPVGFGVLCRGHGVEPQEMLSALGMTMALSVIQAAVRLNLIGQGAATRLASSASPAIARSAARVMEGPARFAPGSFAPGLDVAGMLHPTLHFRMFAS